MTDSDVDFPDHALAAGAIVRMGEGLVLVHPEGGPAEAPASLPGAFFERGESPDQAVVRIVAEQTGLTVRLERELTRFEQLGTPFGPAMMFCFVADATGGKLSSDGPEGPARLYPLNQLPAIIPVRVANQRMLATYLAESGPA